VVARPKSTSRSVHTAVRLPEELHQRLSGAGHGALAQEIKRRLEASLEWETVDPATRELIAAIVEMTTLIRKDVADWHSVPYLREALAQAISGWLRERVPVEVVETRAEEAPVSNTLWARKGDTPETAGENLLRLYKMIFSSERRADLADYRKRRKAEARRFLVERAKSDFKEITRIHEQFLNNIEKKLTPPNKKSKGNE
jgi:hypothetical protein